MFKSLVLKMLESIQTFFLFTKSTFLNELTDYTKNLAKELREFLHKKYKTKNVGNKKFIAGWLLDYKLVNSNIMINLVQELKVIIHETLSEGMILSDTFQVVAIIEKLLSIWKDFKNYLKHKWKEMSIENLIVRLCIKEENWRSKKKGAKTSIEGKGKLYGTWPKFQGKGEQQREKR